MLSAAGSTPPDLARHICESFLTSTEIHLYPLLHVAL